MKKILILLLLGPFLIVSGQKNEHEENHQDDFFHHEKGIKECDTRVQLADSVINFAVNQQTGDLTPVQVLQYVYDNHYNLTQVYCLSLPSRTFIYHQLFSYDNNDNLIKYVNQLWKNGEWVNDLINTRTYSGDGRILYEEFLRKNSAGVFAAYQRHFYNYTGTVIDSYLRQILNAEGTWYDFSHHYYTYDAYGRLTVLYGQYVNNGPVFWERTAIYGSEGRVLERYLKILRYNPTLKQNVLTNSSYQIYSYNIFGNVSELMNHEWINSQWVYTRKDIYYYSMLKNKKVAVCHNGQSICISINALEAHLAHGDELGKCSDESENTDKDRPGTENCRDQSIRFIIYPNPAKNQFTIRFTGEENPYSTGVIMSSAGRVLTTFDATGRSELYQDISTLRKGNYLIRLYKDVGFDTQILIKR